MRLYIIKMFIFVGLVPNGHQRDYRGQQTLTKSVYFHLGRHMVILVHAALCWAQSFQQMLWSRKLKHHGMIFEDTTVSFGKNWLSDVILSHHLSKSQDNGFDWGLRVRFYTKNGEIMYLWWSQVDMLPLLTQNHIWSLFLMVTTGSVTSDPF